MLIDGTSARLSEYLWLNRYPAMIHPIEFNHASSASNPGGLTLSETKLRALEPGMLGIRRVIRKIGGMFLFVDGNVMWVASLLDLFGHQALSSLPACCARILRS